MSTQVTPQMQAQIANLYIAILGRNPEPAGFAYWTDTYANNNGTTAAYNAITMAFGKSPEFIGTYGGRPTAEAIALMYQNVLGRPADAGGLAYWTGIANGLINGSSPYTVGEALALTGAALIAAAAANTGTADATNIAAKQAAAIAAGTAAPTTTYTLTTNIDNIKMDANGTTVGVIDFGGGTTASTGTTMNANDTITALSTSNSDVLKVTLQNAGGAIGGVAATAQTNKITVPTVTADVRQVNQYVFSTAAAVESQSFTYGGLSGSFLSSTTAATQAAAFISALNSVAGSTVAYIGTTSSTNTASTASTTLVLGSANSAIQVGMSITGTGVSAGTTVTAISGATLTLSQAATVGANASLTYGGGAAGVTVYAPSAGVASPSIAFGAVASAGSVPSSSLITANVSGNQGDVVTFTYNGLTGSYTIGATNDATVTNLEAALDATIPAGQAVASIAGSAGSTFVNLVSSVAGTPLATLTFSGAAGNIPTTTTTTANVSASGISFGNNTGLDALYANNISGQTATIDQNSVSSATQLWADRSTSDVVFTNVGKTTTIGINGAGVSTQYGAVTATYVSGTASGTLAINGGARAGIVTINRTDTNAPTLTAITVNSTGGAQTSTAGQVNTLTTSTAAAALALSAEVKTLTINAATSLTLASASGTATISGSALNTINVNGAATTVNLALIGSAITTLNASGMTSGGVTATLNTSAPTNFSFTGGAGTDVITVTGAFTNTITGINGGGGSSDRIVISTAAMTSQTGALFSNFEVLENSVASSTQDASVVSGITSLIANGSGSGFTNMTAAQAANVTVRNTAGNATFNLANSNGTSDVLGLTLQNSTAASVATVINPGQLNISGFETLNVTSNAGVTSIYSSGTTTQTTSGFSFASGGAAQLATINVSGAYAVTTDLTNATVLTTLNAAANTGGLNVTTASTTKALTVTGSATASNRFVLGSLGTDGTQSLIGGGSSDNFVGAQSVIQAATIAGASGTDTLTITDTATSTNTVTIADATFANVTGVERVVLNGGTAIAGALTWSLSTNANSLAAAAPSQTLTIVATGLVTGANTANDITINASSLASGNAVNMTVSNTADSATTANEIILTGSAGNDTIRVTELLAAADTIFNITGGAGNDLITIITTDSHDGTITVNGGDGNDTIDTSGATSDESTVANNPITGGKGNDIIILSGESGTLQMYVTESNAADNGVDTISNFLQGNGKDIYRPDNFLNPTALNDVLTANVGSSTDVSSDVNRLVDIAGGQDITTSAGLTAALAAGGEYSNLDMAGNAKAIFITAMSSGSSETQYVFFATADAGGVITATLVGTMSGLDIDSWDATNF